MYAHTHGRSANTHGKQWKCRKRWGILKLKYAAIDCFCDLGNISQALHIQFSDSPL